MRKKISFEDYTLSNEEKQALSHDARKVYALSKEDTAKLQTLFTARLSIRQDTSISEIMSEAISLLYQRDIES